MLYSFAGLKGVLLCVGLHHWESPCYLGLSFPHRPYLYVSGDMKLAISKSSWEKKKKRHWTALLESVKDPHYTPSQPSQSSETVRRQTTGGFLFLFTSPVIVFPH